MKKLLIAASITLAITTAGAALAQSQEEQSASTFAYDNRASVLIGEEITNAQDEEIGEIDDLIIAEDDKILYAVVSVGGFLGIGEKLVAVAYDDLTITQDEDGDEVEILYPSATKEELEAKPEFEYKEGETPWASRLGNEWNKLKGSMHSETESETESESETATQ